MRITVFICILLSFVTFVYATIPGSSDILAADDMAAQYRTGIIDPAIASIPYHIRANIFLKPEEYLDKLVDFFVKDADNDYHVIKRIHDWITDTIAYQFKAETKIYKFLKIKKTNCAGYSFLLHEMADMAGIPSKVVIGYSRTYQFSNGKQGNHAWNIVTIEGKNYLVDITHDRRMRARGDEFSDKAPYSDNELFIHPQYKLLINMPYNKNYQLIEEPISYNEYMRPPRKRLAFIKYGLEFANSRFQEWITEAEYTWPNSGITGIFDGIKTKGLLHRLTIECPEDVEVAIRVGNFGSNYPEHASYYRRGKHVIFLFSAPSIGSFMTTISARYKGTEDWDRVYTFLMVEETGKGPELN